MNRLNLNFLSFESRTSNPTVAPVLFGVFILAHLVVLFAFLRFAFPWTWQQQLSAGWGAIILTCLACNLVFCFGEFFFHRYLLHIDSIKWLGKLCYAHRAHHKLTSIRFDDRDNAVRSAYAIEALQRHGAMHGSWLSAARVLRCNPWHPGGHDPVPSLTTVA